MADAAAPHRSADSAPTEQDVLIGRKAGMMRLDNAWAGQHSVLIQIVGDGGIGKSALVWHWLKKSRACSIPSHDSGTRLDVYSRGRQEYSADSRDFLEFAMRFFEPMGLTLTARQRRNATEIGRVMAELLLKLAALLSSTEWSRCNTLLTSIQEAFAIKAWPRSCDGLECCPT